MIFVTEKYADQIAAILAQWSFGPVAFSTRCGKRSEGSLADFLGSSLRPAESRVVRPGSSIEVRRNTFKRRLRLGRDAFLQELRAALSGFSKILTAEFQVTSIDAGSMPARPISGSDTDAHPI